MTIRDKLKPILKYLKIAALWGTGSLFIAYHINETQKRCSRIVNPSVLEREKKYTPEYVYIDDPAYNKTLLMEQDRQSKQSVGFARIWKSLKHSLTWRLLWLCRHGTREHLNVALEQLAAFKNNKSWDCLKLAQAMDMHTAVLLARTRGADLRYFLPPPIHVRRAALAPELLSFKLKDILVSVHGVNSHSCIQHFLSKYFVNVQEQAMESDTIPTKPGSISEINLCIQCLDAIHHHLTLFHQKKYEDDVSTNLLIQLGLLPRLSELLLRYRYDVDVDMAVLRILTVLSVHTNLLQDFFQNGLIRELSRMLRSKDVRLSSSAAVCLSNLSGEFCYRPGLYLLHPIYRTTQARKCDTLLVHGLRGGVFVTWRQRDKKCVEPVGIIEVTTSDVDVTNCDPTCTEPTVKKEKIIERNYLDPEIQEVMEDLIEIKEESLLADYDVVLHDLPVQAKRDSNKTCTYTCSKKRIALSEEDEDHCTHTHCWPKDWLPKDCSDLRILGVNYWSSLSEWLERCPLQTADIETRAEDLGPALADAGVGKKSVPVVWLAHSMGGLIVKQVLNEASESTDNKLRLLSENTKAILFYSTPHKGSALAAMPRAAAAVFWPSNDVRQLQENSPTLLNLHSKFINFAEKYNWELVSFAESLPTLVTAFKVPIQLVHPHSADLGRGVFYELPLDHLSICKPATRQSILYTIVLDVIHRATFKEAEVEHMHPTLRWLLNILWVRFHDTAQQLIETIDQDNSTDGLHWFEKMLIDAFTDDFTE